MIRPNKAATKIAFKILGTPPNIAYKPSEKEREINKVILGQNEYRIR